jgi:hypothetical protein
MTENTVSRMKDQVKDLEQSISILNRYIENDQTLSVRDIMAVNLLARLHESWAKGLFDEVVTEIEAEDEREKLSGPRGGGATGNVRYSFKPMPSWKQKDQGSDSA